MSLKSCGFALSLIVLTLIALILAPPKRPAVRWVNGSEGDRFGYDIYEPTEIRIPAMPDDKSVELFVVNPKHFPLTFPKNIQWAGGEVPTQKSGKYALYHFYHHTGDVYYAWGQVTLCGEPPTLTECLF